MTRFKTLCILMLAISCMVWSTQAAIQKSTVVREKPVVVPELNIVDAGKPVQAISSAAGGKDASLTQVVTEQRKFTSTQSPEKPLITDHVVSQVRNPDGTITVGFKAVKNRDSVVSTNPAIYIATLFQGNISGGPYVPSIGRYAAGGYNDLCAFGYFDLSLIPAGVTVTAATVDVSILNVGTYPTGTLRFNINDLFTIITSTPPNNLDVYNDLRNVSGGNTYAAETVGRSTPGTVNYALSAQAVTDISTAINDVELFGLGFDPQVSTDMIWSIGEEFGGGTDPVLYVTYNAPGAAPVITSVTATPSTADNIGFDTITLEATWTDADNPPIDEFGIIFQYRTPWMEEVQLSGGIWEEVSAGSYRWYGEWDPPQDQQIGAYDVRFLVWDGTFTDEWGYTVNDDLFTITTPATIYADFNDSGPLSQWPAGWTVNPVTAPDVSWQYDYVWSGTQDYIAAVFADVNAQNCTITSPAADMSTAGSVHFFFDCRFDGTPTNFVVEGSIDGFATVEDSVELTTAITAGEWSPLNWNITSWAAGQSNVQVRFRFVSPVSATNLAIIDVLQLVVDDAPITITDTSVTPASNPVIDGAYITAFSVDFTAATTATVDDFMFDIYTRSDVGLESALITDLYNGDDMGSTIVQNSPGNFTATIGGLAFRPGIEIGVYDLMGYVTNGIGWAYDDFDSNPDELTLTTPAFWYEDFNEGGAAGPAGWSILSLPGGENGDDWYYEQYTGTDDWFGFILYDQTMPADPQNEVLRTTTINCSGRQDLVLYYAYEWASGYDPAAVGQVRISNDNGATWTTILEHTAPTTPAIETGLEELDISAYADGHAQVRLEFRYIATDDFYWSVDILQIDEDTPLPVPATGPIGLGLLLVTLTILFLRRR